MEQIEKICRDLNQEQDTNNNLFESMEIAQKEYQLKMEEMEEEIQARDALINELDNVIKDLTVQVKRDQQELVATKAKNGVIVIDQDLLKSELSRASIGDDFEFLHSELDQDEDMFSSRLSKVTSSHPKSHQNDIPIKEADKPQSPGKILVSSRMADFKKLAWSQRSYDPSSEQLLQNNLNQIIRQKEKIISGAKI